MLFLIYHSLGHVDIIWVIKWQEVVARRIRTLVENQPGWPSGLRRQTQALAYAASADRVF